jgi:hypothetical protein
MFLLRYLISLVLLIAGLCGAAETVGQRPYEMEWAKRTTDDRPPLIDFEDLSGWRVEVKNAEANFTCSREQQIWGEHVGRLAYKALGNGDSEVRLLLPQPLALSQPFDALTCWIYGNRWGYESDTTTPAVTISVLFEDRDSKELEIVLFGVDWKEWHLCHRRLTPDQIKAVAAGAKLKGFRFAGGTNREERLLYLDNFAAFTELFAPLTFTPRPERGVAMFPGQSPGTNTGPGKLPFPTRPETILPDNLTEDFTTAVRAEGDAFVLAYAGADGKLTYRIEPRTGTFANIAVRWDGRGGEIRPCVGGGVFLAGPTGPVAPETAESLGTQVKGDTVESRWRLTAGTAVAEVALTYRLWHKSLVLDVVALGGQVAEVRWGVATGLDNPRLVPLPYYTYGSAVRPAVAVAGPPEAPLFLAENLDWTRSNGSWLWAENAVSATGVACNGGVRYIAKTDGRRNDCFERLFINLSPRFEEALPTLPNPVSPWKHVAGSRLWRAHGAGDRASDIALWTRVQRHGITEMVVTDHETGWRDGGESFTFRTRAAPGKGGDEGQFEYARVMQDKLGFVYGPYNTFTAVSPVNEFWDPDLIGRTAENEFQPVWMRCYAPKPARAVEFAERLAPIIQKKFHFSTAYCDVHTQPPPWYFVDYDPRVPGAGTFAAVYYAYGEIMLLQKQAWNGPVYSEGNNHFAYSGLTDGNYAQDAFYGLPTNPWLVDFDLRKMHDLCCNFGMGNPEMFYGQGASMGRTPAETDAAYDRFLAATVAFGHPGFLALEGGFGRGLRSYYLLQQLQSRYTLGSAKEIRYADAAGKLLDSTAAVATGAYTRSQVATRYGNDCVTVVNGHPTERLRVSAFGRQLDLPPNGYAGWTADGAIEVLSGDVDGRRCDYAATPAYLYADGRGRFARFPKAASDGIGICRILPNQRYEVIPYEGSDCGFAIAAVSAVALDTERKELGPAELRTSRGLIYVVPVKGALSYLLTAGQPPRLPTLTCDRDRAIPGEQITVRGKTEHVFTVPTEAKPGARLWQQFEGAWIDFTVMPLAEVVLSLAGGTALSLEMTGNLPQPAAAEVTVSAVAGVRSVTLQPRVSARLSVDIPAPTHEGIEPLSVTLKAGGLAWTTARLIVSVPGHGFLANLLDTWQSGVGVRGAKDVLDLGESGAQWTAREVTCGGEARKGFFAHPPWQGGTGYTFVLSAPVALPAAPPAALRAKVGKSDGSYLGDGILYKVVVVDAEGRETVAGEQTATRHEWLPIQADLGPWAGTAVRLKLVTDVGVKDSPEGDWGCWADLRLETRDEILLRTLEEADGPSSTLPGPARLPGLTADLLRHARQGWLRYDAMGLNGGEGGYPSFAVLNDIRLGPMVPGGGDEGRGIWAEKLSVPLTPEAIASLGLRNRFRLDNAGKDWFKVRRFWLELEFADGRKCTSEIAAAVFTQPPTWAHAEGIGVPFGEDIAVNLWFRP